jgi:anaerobic ribonucleoside-triphosphate reductase activating protein
MKYAKIIENDTVNCIEGITVSLFMSGCPHHCKGCFNSIAWNPNFGTEINIEDLCDELNKLIQCYGIKRNFSILGGEPLAEYNRKDTNYIIHKIKEQNEDIIIYLWSGYTLNELVSMNDDIIIDILDAIDYLIDGRFEINKKNTSLRLRGSSNQHIYKKINGKLKLIE